MKLLKAINERVAQPYDSPSAVMQKTTILVVSVLTAIAGIQWGLLYLSLGHPQAAAIPFTYSVLVGVSLISGLLGTSTSVVVFVFSGSSATGDSPHALRMAMLRISKNRDKTFIRFPWGGVCKSTSDKLI